MFKEIKKYLADNKKSFYRKLFILALFLFIIGVFYGNFILVKKLVANLISEEKNTHAQEVCTTLDDINQKTGTHYDLDDDGLIIYTTIDSRLQSYAEQAVNQHLQEIQKTLDTQW